MSYNTDGSLQCDMKRDCPDDVTYIDRDGFVYCTDHGLGRQMYQPCRKLRSHELNRLKRGEPVKRY